MKHPLYKARDFLAKPAIDMWEHPPGPINLEFDDGILETSMYPTVYSRYIWELANRYPNVRLLMKHHMGTRKVNNKLQINMLSDLACDIMYTSIIPGYDLREEIPKAYYPTLPHKYFIPDSIGELGEAVYDVTTDIYNDFIVKTEKYMRGISARDFIELQYHPKIVEIMDALEPTEESIEAAYKALDAVIVSNPEFDDNSVVLFYRCGNVRPKQLLELVGPRGFLDDIDNTIAPNPILTSYTMGHRKLRDHVIESRAASRALLNNGKQLEDSERSNRENQLFVTVIGNLHYMNCGTELYDVIQIRDKHDLEQMEGIYQVLENSNIRPIRLSDTHLIGTLVKYRSANTCASGDAYGLCACCYGLLSYSLGKNTSVGHVAAITLGERITQIIMSTKHYDGSGKVEPLAITPDHQRYLTSDVISGDVFLNTNIKCKGSTLTIQASGASHITDVYEVQSVKDLSLSRTSNIEKLMLTIGNGNDIPFEVVIPTLVSKRPSMLTYEMLEYIKVNGWDLDVRSDIVINLDKWDINTPILHVPSKRLNMGDYLDGVKNVLHSIKKKTNLKCAKSTSEAVSMLHDVVKVRSAVNIAHLAIIVRSAQITSLEDRNFEIPLPSNDVPEYGSLKELMGGRSATQALAHESQGAFLTDPRNYAETDRVNSNQDRILMPTIQKPNI